MYPDIRADGILAGGTWHAEAASNLSFDVRSPATGDVLAILPCGAAADVNAAVRAACDAFDSWARTDASRRGLILMRLADRIEAEEERISWLESSDNGRPRRETLAQARIISRWFRYFGGMADKIEGETIPVDGNYLNYTYRVPMGVCGAITPWNHPALIATKKIAPALACGNTLVLKPSELAPLSVLEIARLALDAGVPPGVLNVVPGQREAGEALVAHPDVARIDLTGSTPTGVAIARAASGSMKRLVFVLGGMAANLVFEDADFERAVDGTVFSGYIAQGQSCVAGSRVLVQRSFARRFADAMAERVRAIRAGDPLDLRTQIGPLITPEAAQRVHAYVEDSLEHGAEVLAGGHVPKLRHPGLVPDGFYAPTLLWAADPELRVNRDEIFGPVVSVIPFDSESDAIRIANALPFGLGAGIWTTDVHRAHRVAAALRAGILWINDYHRIDPASPWGGFGLSGYGRENGFEAVRMFTEVKSVWVGTDRHPVDWYRSEAVGRLN